MVRHDATRPSLARVVALVRTAPEPARGAFLLVFAAVAYLAPASAVIWLNDPARVGAGFWPSAGCSLAILLVVPARRWPWAIAGIGLAEIGGDLAYGYPTAGIPWYAAGNLIEPLLAAALLKRLQGECVALVPLRNMLLFIAVAVLLAPLTGAAIGTAGTILNVPGTRWGDVLPKYAAGDALGVLVVAPAVLLARYRGAAVRTPIESAGLVLALGAWTLCALPDWPGAFDLVAPYAALLPLTWAALRFGMFGAACSFLYVALAANLLTAFGLGPFVGFALTAHEAIAIEQLFLLLLGAGMFVLAALAHELSDRREVQRLLQDLAESVPQLVWQAVDSGVPRYFNGRRASYFAASGARPEDGDWRALVHPDDMDGTRDRWYDRDTHDLFEHEHRLRMADGSFRWHLSRARRVNAFGEVRWYGTSTDIHDLKVAEQLKDEFVAVASHELRNPVAATHGLAQLVRRMHQQGTLVPERLDRYTAALLENTAYLARLTDDLLDVSRLQRGMVPAQARSVALGDLVRSVATLPQWPAGRVRVHPGAEPGAWLVDPDRLTQALSNLIENALKYSPPDSAVDLHVERGATGVTIDVVDRGTGIPPEAADRVFAPFGRGDNTTGTGGLGMGLYIARRIVELQGGQVDIKRSTADGTTMRVAFPSRLAQAACRCLLCTEAEAAPAASPHYARAAVPARNESP